MREGESLRKVSVAVVAVMVAAAAVKAAVGLKEMMEVVEEEMVAGGSGVALIFDGKSCMGAVPSTSVERSLNYDIHATPNPSTPLTVIGASASLRLNTAAWHSGPGPFHSPYGTLSSSGPPPIPCRLTS